MNNEEIYELVRQPDDKWQNRDNIYDLCGLARQVPKYELILDIGIGGCVSACALALAADPTVKVISAGPDVREITIDTINRTKTWGRVILAPGTSDQFFASWNVPFYMVFIDGLHEYQAVKNDCNNSLKFLPKGGILSSHDYHLYNNTIGLALDEIFQENKERLELIKVNNNLISYRVLKDPLQDSYETANNPLL